jgi:hypothetical protein
MHSRRRLFVAVLSGLVGLVGLATVAGADPDPRLQPLLDRARAQLTDPHSAFLRERIEVAVNGQKQQDQLQEVWVRDLQHVRLERSDGTVVVMTPEDVKMYIGPARLLLHIPQETLTALGDGRAEALQKVDLNDPADNLKMIIDNAELLQVTGEDTIGDEACWVVTADEKLFPSVRKILSSVPEGFDLKTVQLALGRETGITRSMFLEFTGPAQLEVGVTVELFDDHAEVTDDQFKYEAPEGTRLLTWTPDKTGDQMRAARDQAIAEQMK